MKFEKYLKDRFPTKLEPIIINETQRANNWYKYQSDSTPYAHEKYSLWSVVVNLFKACNGLAECTDSAQLADDIKQYLYECDNLIEIIEDEQFDLKLTHDDITMAQSVDNLKHLKNLLMDLAKRLEENS